MLLGIIHHNVKMFLASLMYKGSTSSKVCVVSSTLLLWWRRTVEHEEAGGEYLYYFVTTLSFRSIAQVYLDASQSWRGVDLY